MSKFLKSVAVLVFAFGATNASALTLDPAQCGLTLSCDSGPENNQNDVVDAVQGLYPGIMEVYKQDQGGGETGSFAGDYMTQFLNTPSDPQEALITWNGPNFINCPNCFVLVADGNQDPAWYLIEINSWDGKEDINLQNFWPAQGAISNVGIWTQPIPVPAAVWLFGSGLLGLVGVARRKRS